MKNKSVCQVASQSSRTIVAWLFAAMVGTCVAAPVELGINQSTSVSNSQGQTANIKHVGNTSRVDYKNGQAYEDTGDLNTSNAMIGFANWARLAFTGNSGTSQSTVNELFKVDDFGEDERYEARITSPGNKLVVDNASGKIVGFSGSEVGNMSGKKMSGMMTGGMFSIKNLRFNLNSNTIHADGSGVSLPVQGTSIPELVYNSPNMPTFTYESLSGPVVIPLYAFKQGQNTKSILEAAGFRVWSISATSVTFSGLYQFSKIRLTPETRDLMALSFRLFTTPQSALQSVNQDPAGMGNILVSVMLSASISQ